MKRAPDFSALPEWGTHDRRLTKLDRGSLAFDTQSEASIDVDAMSATAVISTPTPDRIKDSMNPQGCLLDNYRKNPVVLWEHGFGGIQLPVGKSEDPEGNLTIALSDAAVLGTCYFSQKLLEPAQIFELVVERIIRATSIRFSPIKQSIRRDPDGENYNFDEWDLEEWSWVTVPCNPEAVTGVISKGRLAGKPIAEPILKSLQLWLPERAAQARGWNPDKENTVAKTNDKPANDQGKPNTKAKADDKPEEEETPPADETSTETGKATEEPAANEVPADEATDQQQKYGAQYLTAVHTALSDLIAQATAGKGMLENPKVQKGIDSAMPLLEKAAAILEGCHSDAYGDAMKSPAKSADLAAQRKALNDFLEAGNAPRLELKGFAARVKAVAKASNLTAEQRSRLAKTAEQMEAMVSDALAESKTKGAEPPAETVDPKIKQQVDDLTKTVGELAKSFKDVLPFRKAV